MAWVVLIGGSLVALAIVAVLIRAAVRALVDRRFGTAGILALLAGAIATVLDADPVPYAVAAGAVSLALSAMLRSRRSRIGPQVQPATPDQVSDAPAAVALTRDHAVSERTGFKVEPFERVTAASRRAGASHPSAIRGQPADPFRSFTRADDPADAPAPPRPAPSLLDLAWEDAVDLTGGDARVAQARARCDTLLSCADTDPGDADVAEWAAFVRQHVPQLVDAALNAAAEATEPDRRAVAEDLAGALSSIGGKATEQLAPRRRRARDAFTTMRNFVASRSGQNEGWTDG